MLLQKSLWKAISCNCKSTPRIVSKKNWNHDTCYVTTYGSWKKGMSQDKATMSSEEIKSVALSIVRWRCQSVSQLVENREFLKFYRKGLGLGLFSKPPWSLTYSNYHTVWCSRDMTNLTALLWFMIVHYSCLFYRSTMVPNFLYTKLCS